jgi:hypothetical protein
MSHHTLTRLSFSLQPQRTLPEPPRPVDQGGPLSALKNTRGQGQRTAMKHSTSRLFVILALGLFFIPIIAMAQQTRKVPPIPRLLPTQYAANVVPQLQPWRLLGWA